MALINCLECNAEISDKAQQCIKCGSPIMVEEINIQEPEIVDKPKILKWSTSGFGLFFWLALIVLIALVGTNVFKRLTGPLEIDGSSIPAFRSSGVRMVKSVGNDTDKIKKLGVGYIAAKARASEAMWEMGGLGGVMETISSMSDEEVIKYQESINAKQEEIEASILNGMTVEEIIKYGEDYEKATGIEHFPSTEIPKKWTDGGNKSQKKDKCQELATTQLVNKLAPEILKKTDNFGENIVPVINQCQYFSNEDTLLLSLQIGWNGPLTGEYYQTNGRLTVGPKGWDWETTGGNTNLKAWSLLKGAAVALAEHGKKKHTNILLKNNCHKSISVGITYKPLNSAWVTQGWWTVKGGEKIKTDIRTKTRDVYFYAEDGGTSSWNGSNDNDGLNRIIFDHKFRYEEGNAVSGKNEKTVVFFKRDSGKHFNDYEQHFGCTS